MLRQDPNRPAGEDVPFLVTLLVLAILAGAVLVFAAPGCSPSTPEVSEDP